MWDCVTGCLSHAAVTRLHSLAMQHGGSSARSGPTQPAGAPGVLAEAGGKVCGAQVLGRLGQLLPLLLGAAQDAGDGARLPRGAVGVERACMRVAGRGEWRRGTAQHGTCSTSRAACPHRLLTCPAQAVYEGRSARRSPQEGRCRGTDPRLCSRHSSPIHIHRKRGLQSVMTTVCTVEWAMEELASKQAASSAWRRDSAAAMAYSRYTLKNAASFSSCSSSPDFKDLKSERAQNQQKSCTLVCPKIRARAQVGRVWQSCPWRLL